MSNASLTNSSSRLSYWRPSLRMGKLKSLRTMDSLRLKRHKGSCRRLIKSTNFTKSGPRKRDSFFKKKIKSGQLSNEGKIRSAIHYAIRKNLQIDPATLPETANSDAMIAEYVHQY